jgi:glucan phosphorylase
MKEIKDKITIRLDETTKQKLLELQQESEETNVSKIIKQCINSSIITIPTKQHTQDYKRVLYLLSNIANNINQIARYANINKELDVKVLEELQKINEFISKVD